MTSSVDRDRPNGSRGVPWPAAALVTALSLALGAITLTRKSFWFDEIFDVRAVAGSWHGIIGLIRETEMSQAAYLVVLKLWASGTGTSELALRAPSVVAAAVAAGLLVLLGTRLFTRWTGVLAGVLFALNDLVVQWSQQARTYSFVTLTVVATTYLFVRAIDDDRWSRCLTYVVVAAASVYFHFYAGLVVVTQAACLPFVRPRPHRSRLGVSAVLFVLFVLPALYFTHSATRTQLSWIETPTATTLSSSIVQSVGHNPVVGLLALAGLVLLASQWTTDVQRWRSVLVGSWWILPLVLGALLSFVQPILVPRYLIVTTPAIALLAAHAVVTLARQRRMLAAACLAGSIAVSAYWIQHWYGRTPEDWRGAAAFVASERRHSDAIVVIPSWSAAALLHYAPELDVGSTIAPVRTLVVIRVDDDDEPGAASRRVVDPSTMRLVHRDWFGERIAVETWQQR